MTDLPDNINFNSNGPKILAFESSCDETAAAVIHNGKIFSNKIATQDIHEQYGGVVPELASRAHLSNIIPVTKSALGNQFNIADMDAIAFTAGPGLLGPLLVGVTFAKTIAMAYNKPLIAVNHMQAHVLAHFINDPKPDFPFLCLTVSGGHTEIVLVKSHLDMEIIGSTRDDAAGEAFDKTAKLLGLPYPGGPLVDKMAQSGDPEKFKFPDTSMPDYDYSFSGLKTAVLYFLQKNLKNNPEFISNNLPDICAAVQSKIVEMLLEKLELAANNYSISHLCIAGGVSANSFLRKSLIHLCEKNDWQYYLPDFQYCTDNAGMVAMAAHYQYIHGRFAPENVIPNPRMKF